MKIVYLILILSFIEINANNSSCNIGSGFIESKQNPSIYKKLTPHCANIDDLKKFIARENNCNEHNITFLKIIDYREGGKYEVCINNRPLKYIRTGFIFTNTTNRINMRLQLINCSTPFQFKKHNIGSDILCILLLFISLVLYTICIYYLLYALKLILFKIKKINKSDY